MKQLQLETLVLGPVSTNCYLAKNRESGALLLIDPADCADVIARKIAGMRGTPEAILLTHGHFDHIGAAMELKNRFAIPICALDQEQEVLKDPVKNLTGWNGSGYGMTADRCFTDGEELVLAGFAITVLHTPGHTVGSTCYYLPEEEVLFSGDTLFHCSVGRTDFPTGSMGDIHRSLHEKLFMLPEKTEVFPGHDAATTIQYEKRFNPY
ncbi:MAG: MBL fold metallo-hydrolase [Lachnospiraceae bacterium]|nr:MBL fold metallo-hydrolase [Lachnospiraceae bacterium]